MAIALSPNQSHSLSINPELYHMATQQVLYAIESFERDRISVVPRTVNLEAHKCIHKSTSTQ